MIMPTLRIIETDARNAFASGLQEGNYSVTITRGLVDILDKDELETVLAHELTHIRNRDVQLLVVSTILVGVVPIIHQFAVRAFGLLVNSLLNFYQRLFTILPMTGAKPIIIITYKILFLVGKFGAYVIGTVGHFCSLLISFALSRKREFLADAGAIELTKNPDALISSLRKIADHSNIPTAIDGVHEMCFDKPHITGLGGLLSTHPPVEKRIEAIIRYGRDVAKNARRKRFSGRPS